MKSSITQLGPQVVETKSPLEKLVAKLEAKADPKIADDKSETAPSFAKQLAKVKPVVKKPEVATPDVAATQPTTPDQPSLIQILAALLNGAAVQPQAADAVVAPPAKPAIAQAADIATAQVADTAKDALLQQMVAVKPEPAKVERAEPPLTPMEQAVHDLLSELADKAPAKSADSPEAPTVSLAPAPTLAPIDRDPAKVAQAAPVQREQPAELVSQNHAHLVFDDANGRVVMTVAVRGAEVNVSMRASDDATAASLARNAASLDDAMRGRGLALAQFDSQRDLAREQNQDKPTYQRDREPKRQNQRFTLEEPS